MYKMIEDSLAEIPHLVNVKGLVILFIATTAALKK